MAFESGGGQRFPYTYDQVFSGLLRVIPAEGFTLKSQDKDIGRIECSAGMSLLSFGENISISVEDVDGFSARVDIQSGLKFQGNRNAIFTGEGRNAKNVRTIISALTNYLKTQTKPERPSLSIPASSPPLPPTKALSFFIYINEQVKGPFSTAQIDALMQVDSVTPMTPCCPAGSQEWQTVADFVT